MSLKDKEERKKYNRLCYIENKEEFKQRNTNVSQTDANGNSVPVYIDVNGNNTNDFTKAVADQSLVDQERFKYLEFYKVKFI